MNGLATRKVGHPERDIQMAAVRWATAQYPNILMTMSPSGVKPGGNPKQVMIQRANMIRMGYRKGTADLMIFEPRGGFHGLFVEIKTEEGKPSPEQENFVDEARKRGYCAGICYGFNEVVNLIKTYMET